MSFVYGLEKTHHACVYRVLSVLNGSAKQQPKVNICFICPHGTTRLPVHSYVHFSGRPSYYSLSTPSVLVEIGKKKKSILLEDQRKFLLVSLPDFYCSSMTIVTFVNIVVVARFTFVIKTKIVLVLLWLL